ncbi:uncharacterized protein [Physcomitrium patens]|uniref:F-box domain-containing protein n=1 Tax=Physcomitrium patens TaxID=3218 RepID=A0A2K1JEB5_PHYPA|nr:uncharacterized protein LOC112292006 isoform X1 [Physcomitrium patens]PNR39876.1 hypothetical protein PHYPA_020156 [Physcomitrium patens]|eukprot:XP_024395836.1 uncharacterized protein LOC112292006 isoform X1 [Physcomitrella patens]
MFQFEPRVHCGQLDLQRHNQSHVTKAKIRCQSEALKCGTPPKGKTISSLTGVPCSVPRTPLFAGPSDRWGKSKAVQKRPRDESVQKVVKQEQAEGDSLGGKRPTLTKVCSVVTTAEGCSRSNSPVRESGSEQKIVDTSPDNILNNSPSSGNAAMDYVSADEPTISCPEAADSDSARAVGKYGNGTASLDGTDLLTVISPDDLGPQSFRDELDRCWNSDWARAVEDSRDVTDTIFATDFQADKWDSNPPGIEDSGDGCSVQEIGDSWFSQALTDFPTLLPSSFCEAMADDVPTEWECIPEDLRSKVLQRLEMEDLFRFKGVTKSSRNHIESDEFSHLRGGTYPSEGSFTAISFFLKDKAWQWIGLDIKSKHWRRLPTLSCLPAPDFDLFKEYSVAGASGLMCVNVSKSSKMEEIVVFNPLTGKKKVLPPLTHRRNPVLLHVSVDSETKTYKVIAAGSSSERDGGLSRRIEVFDSRTSKWELRHDLPTCEFGLNENQTGVYVDGILYFVAHLEKGAGRGILAYDVEKDTWSKERTCPIPSAKDSNVLQLVENSGNVYLFSEQECQRVVTHCIDALVKSDTNDGGAKWHLKNVIRVKSRSGRGLQVYPEYMCCGYGPGKLVIFNTLRRDGVVYDVETRMQCETLQAPPAIHSGDKFFSLNPLSFTLQPSFASDNLI